MKSTSQHIEQKSYIDPKTPRAPRYSNPVSSNTNLKCPENKENGQWGRRERKEIEMALAKPFNNIRECRRLHLKFYKDPN